MAISKRAALLSGFAIIVGLLVLSTALAHQIQSTFSEKSAEIHRRYVHQQELLTNLRRILYLAGATVRDFLINPAPDRRELYASQVGSLQQDGNKLLTDLRKTGDRAHTVSALEVLFDDLWRTLSSSTVDGWDDQRKYQFIQQEIIPRRETANQLLRELERANHGSLAESEEEFRDSRTAATTRLLVLLAFCLVTGCLIAYFSLRYFDLLERQAVTRFGEVSDAKLELERLSARLMEIQEEERRRLSRELHDEIVQNLAVLKMDIIHTQRLTQERAPEARETLNRARALAERTVKAVRDISLLLRPSLLDDLGLSPALQWLTEDFKQRTGVPCDFNESSVTDKLPDPINTCVYRVTQEALRNCEKHSKATHVQVRLQQTDREITVEICDDGVGFEGGTSIRRAPKHLGVLGMRERAAAAGGQLVATSSPGAGTTIRLSIPLTANPNKSVEPVETYV